MVCVWNLLANSIAIANQVKAYGLPIFRKGEQIATLPFGVLLMKW